MIFRNISEIFFCVPERRFSLHLCVRLVVAAVGRSEGVALVVAQRTETEVETCSEELAGKDGLAAESMDGPPLEGTQLFLQRKQLVKSPHAVECHGFGALFTDADLPYEECALDLDLGTT